jgi:hypothetical protein
MNNRDIAIRKNEQLIKQLEDNRKSMLGIGTNKIKRRLNSLAENDIVAKGLRLLLETEDINIIAKKQRHRYKDKSYAKKFVYIHQLIDLFKENGWLYGRHESNVYETNYIIFFELPGTKQISFHSNLKNPKDIPIYEKEWDGLVNSTLNKISEKIKNDYPQIIY